MKVLPGFAKFHSGRGISMRLGLWHLMLGILPLYTQVEMIAYLEDGTPEQTVRNPHSQVKGMTWV